MSTNRDFPNSGILFRNDRKDGDRDRDYKGSGDVTCPHCECRFPIWLSAWIKEGRNGKFMSLSFKPKDDQLSQPRDDTSF